MRAYSENLKLKEWPKYCVRQRASGIGDIRDPEDGHSFLFFLESHFLPKNQFFKVQCNAKNNTSSFMAFLIAVNVAEIEWFL